MNTSVLSTSVISGDTNVQLITWIGVIVILLVIEASTATLTTIWFACGAVFAAVLSALDVGLEWHIITFICASALMLILTRPLVKKLLNKKNVTNKDTLIGTVSYVTEKIDNIAQSGYVKINDVYWAARSIDNSTIEKGVLVEVRAIQGNKLIVSTVKGDD